MSGFSFDDAAGLERVTETLRRTPAVRDGAADRVVAAAFARRHRMRRRQTWMARAAGLMVAAGLGAGGMVLYRGAFASVPTTAATAEPTPAATPIANGPGQFAAYGGHDEAPVEVPFALRRPNAKRVALVGDFDDWSPTAVPMTRGPGDTWTATIHLAPGRHAFAYVVDDSIWVLDPRAERVRDVDYGRDHSVIVVARP